MPLDIVNPTYSQTADAAACKQKCLDRLQPCNIYSFNPETLHRDRRPENAFAGNCVSGFTYKTQGPFTFTSDKLSVSGVCVNKAARKAVFPALEE